MTGYVVELLWVVAGLAPGTLAVTGGVMWLERQRRRTAEASPAWNDRVGQLFRRPGRAEALPYEPSR